MYPTIIVSNFFENPDEIIEYSKIISWHKATEKDFWPGYRSDNLFYTNKKLHNEIVKKILKLYFGNTNCSVDSTNVQFSKINYEDWVQHKHSRIHKDSFELAAVIYLNKTNNMQTGTSLYDEQKRPKISVSNCFNTLVCYDGNNYHGATDLDKNERLTIVVFIDKIKEM